GLTPAAAPAPCAILGAGHCGGRRRALSAGPSGAPDGRRRRSGRPRVRTVRSDASVDVEPAPALAHEAGALVLLHAAVRALRPGDELDGARIVEGAARARGEHVQPQPAHLLAQ